MGIYKYLYVYWLYIIANLFFFFGKIRIFAVLTDDGCNHFAEQAVNLLNFRLGYFYAYSLLVV